MRFLQVWDIQTRTIRHTFSGHEQDIYSLDFARNGKHIASGSGDRTVRLWDMDSGREVLNLSIDDGVTTVAISPGGEYVAAGSLDKSVRVWDSRNGILIERLEGPEGHKDSVYSVAFAPNGRSLVSGSLDKTIKMWELADSRPLIQGGLRGGKCVRTFEGHKVSEKLKLNALRASSKMLMNSCRILSSAWHLLLMANGCSVDQRIEAYSFGIPARATPSSCYKVTRIQVSKTFLETRSQYGEKRTGLLIIASAPQSSQSLPARRESFSPREVAICVPASGGEPNAPKSP